MVVDDVLVPLYHEHVHKNVRRDGSMVAHLYNYYKIIIKYTNIQLLLFDCLPINFMEGRAL